MSSPFRREDLESMAAFLAGAGVGAILVRGLPVFRRGLAAGWWGNPSDTGRPAPVAASLARMQALLGEIRGLLGPRAGNTAEPAMPAAAGGEAGTGPAPDGPASADEPPAREAWRIPDRISYRISPGAPDLRGLLALGAAVAGAAAGYAAVRKGGAAAAWPALSGFAGALAWSFLGGRARSIRTGRPGPPASMPGPRGSRSGRPALP